MPAATAIAASSVAISASANARAREAQKIACTDFVELYKGSTVTETRQQYAECIELLYPQPASAEHILVGKVLVAAIFVGIIVGLIKAALDDDKWDTQRWFFYPIMFGISFPLAIIVLGLLAEGAVFLFS